MLKRLEGPCHIAASDVSSTPPLPAIGEEQDAVNGDEQLSRHSSVLFGKFSSFRLMRSTFFASEVAIADEKKIADPTMQLIILNLPDFDQPADATEAIAGSSSLKEHHMCYE